MSSIGFTKRRPPMWPMAAMAFLVGLLATFLTVQFLKKDEEPTAEQKVQPTSTAAAIAKKGTQPPPPAPTAPPKDTRATAAAKFVKQARQALDSGQLSEATNLVAQARQIQDSPEAEKLQAEIVEALRKRSMDDEVARLERERQKEDRERLARKERELTEKREREREAQLLREEEDRKAREKLAIEERNKAEAALAAIADDIARFRKERRWEAAYKQVTDLLIPHPVIRGVAAYTALLNGILQERDENLAALKHAMEEAKKLAEKGRGLDAWISVRSSWREFYPESKEAPVLMRKFIDDRMNSQLVRIVLPAGVTVKLGDPSKTDEKEHVYAGGAFLLDKFEVTNEDFYWFVLDTERKPPSSRLWPNGAPHKEALRHPVTDVSAADAEAYAKWAKKRLPTEDEWEVAARWVDGRVFPWGNAFPEDAAPKANTIEVMRPGERTTPMIRTVGSFPEGQSPFGVFDLAGNVWEWTATADGPFRILKGGSFATTKEAARASTRLADDPGLGHPDVGFRCAR